MYTLSRCLQTIIKWIAMHCLHKLSISNFNMFWNLRNQQAQNILFDLETYINHHVFHSTLVRIVQLPDHTIPLSVLWSSLQFHVFIDMPLHDYFIFLLVYHFLCSPVFCMLLLSLSFILGCYLMLPQEFSLLYYFFRHLLCSVSHKMFTWWFFNQIKKKKIKKNFCHPKSQMVLFFMFYKLFIFQNNTMWMPTCTYEQFFSIE